MTTISDKLSSTWTFISEMPSKDTVSFRLLLVAAASIHEFALVKYLAMAGVGGNAWVNNMGGAMEGSFGETGIDYAAYEYPVHTNRVFIQHGMNLGIAGLFSDMAIVALIFNWEAAPLIAFVPFIMDVANFIAIDLPGVRRLFASAQTFIISVGLICAALFRYLNSSKGSWDVLEMVPYLVSGAGLILAAIVNAVVLLVAGGWGSPILMDGSNKYSDAIKK